MSREHRKAPKTPKTANGIELVPDAQLAHVSGAGLGSGGRARFHELVVVKTTDKATPVLF